MVRGAYIARAEDQQAYFLRNADAWVPVTREANGTSGNPRRVGLPWEASHKQGKVVVRAIENQVSARLVMPIHQGRATTLTTLDKAR